MKNAMMNITPIIPKPLVDTSEKTVHTVSFSAQFENESKAVKFAAEILNKIVEDID